MQPCCEIAYIYSYNAWVKNDNCNVDLCSSWWLPWEYRWRPLLKITRSESSVIPFLVSRRKVWLTPTARVPCSNAANIGECNIWMQSEFCTWQNSVRGQQPQKCIYSVLVQETAKRRTKFGWPPLTDVGAVMKPRCETRLNLLGCPKLTNRSQPLVGWSSPYCGHVEEILLFNKFFYDCRYMP